MDRKNVRPGSGGEAGDDGRCMVDMVYFGDQLNSSSEIYSSAFQVCLGLIDSTSSRLCYLEQHPQDARRLDCTPHKALTGLLDPPLILKTLAVLCPELVTQSKVPRKLHFPGASSLFG